MLCSVVKHVGSGKALKKWAKTLDCVCCVFPNTSFVLCRFLRSLQQNRAQPRLLYLLIKNLHFEWVDNRSDVVENGGNVIVYVFISFHSRDVLCTLSRLFVRPGFRLFCARLAVHYLAVYSIQKVTLKTTT